LACIVGGRIPSRPEAIDQLGIVVRMTTLTRPTSVCERRLMSGRTDHDTRSCLPLQEKSIIDRHRRPKSLGEAGVELGAGTAILRPPGAVPPDRR